MQGLEKLSIKLKENHESIHIARVPKDVKQEFIDLANKDFCGDYGMALKWFVDGLMNAGEEMIMAKLEELDNRVQSLENNPVTEDKKVIKLMDGKEVRTGGKEK